MEDGPIRGGGGGGGLISSGLAQQCTVFVKGVHYE